MDEKQTDALQRQVEHWQQKFREEEHHNRELQHQLDTAMADRSKLSHDLRVKTILVEDMSKELEELAFDRSTCTCKGTSSQYKEEQVAQASDETGPIGKAGKLDSQFVLRMMLVERQLQWMMHRDFEDQKKLMEERKAKIEELGTQVAELTTRRDQLSEDVARETKLREDTEAVVGRLNTRIKELSTDLRDTKAQLEKKNEEHEKLLVELDILKQERRSLQDQISAANLSLQTLCKDIQTKDTNLEEKTKRINELVTKVKESEESIKGFAEQIKEMATKLQRTQADNDALSTQVKELKCRSKAENDQKSTKIKDFERSMAAKDEEIKRLTWRLESEEIEEGALEGEVEILDNEMSDAMTTEVIKLVREKALKTKDMLEITAAVREEFGTRHGKYWNCIIGRNVSHSISYTGPFFVNFIVNGHKVLVYKD